MPDLADIGVLGLAVMGANLARNAARKGFGVALFNRHPERTDELVREHGREGRFFPSHALPDFVASLKKPRAIIIMVQAGRPVDDVIEELTPLLEPDDIVIDGGNSLFTDTARRYKACAAKRIRFVGMGVSGGEVGALEGPSMMPGGDRAAYDRIAPILNKMAASVGGTPCCTYVGPEGAGHYVKMVHNGIEYGLMQAYAEGFEAMHKSEYKLDLPNIANLWGRGSVVRSWLLMLTAKALEKDPGLKQIRGYVEDSGEGRWAVQDAIDKNISMPVITMALFTRFRSRADKGEGTFGEKLLAALRDEFGGHGVVKE